MSGTILKSNLYVSDIAITRPIPDGNYLKRLPVVENLIRRGRNIRDNREGNSIGEL
ncbi:MAG: hypothetical protein J6R94_03090 [Agathobacter sp.]|nr:hypothetical protein [Agathobacter sp.]